MIKPLEPLPAASTRIYGYVARDAPVCVIVRRGPSKRVRMLLWDLVTDRVTTGQWVASRVYEERCAVSPDGQLFMYFAANFKSGPGDLYAFTAISRPPYFTAFALWPVDHTWGGGGWFPGPRSAVLRSNFDLPLLEGKKIPPRFGVVNAGAWTTSLARATDSERVAAELIALDGWVEPGRKACPARGAEWLQRTLHGSEVNGPFRVRSYNWTRTLKARDTVLDLGKIDWADWDHEGSVLFAKNGRLYRQRDMKKDAVEIADLRGQEFEAIASPPWAKGWPTT